MGPAATVIMNMHVQCPILSAKNDEAANSQLLHSIDWMSSQGIADNAKCGMFCLTLGDDACLYIIACVWGHHFPLCDKRAIRVAALAFPSEQLPPLRWPGTCAEFATKSGHDIIRASYDDVPMMWGFWTMTFTSHLHQGWGIIGRMHGGRGSHFWDFKCRAHRAELIPSSVI